MHPGTPRNPTLINSSFGTRIGTPISDPPIRDAYLGRQVGTRIRALIRDAYLGRVSGTPIRDAYLGRQVGTRKLGRVSHRYTQLHHRNVQYSHKYHKLFTKITETNPRCPQTHRSSHNLTEYHIDSQKLHIDSQKYSQQLTKYSQTFTIFTNIHIWVGFSEAWVAFFTNIHIYIYIYT